MLVNEKELDEFIRISESEGHRYASRDDARASAQSLVALADIALKQAVFSLEQEDRLVKEPKGFAFSAEGRTCPLCKESVLGEMWFDKWGMKCMDCQVALNKKIVPGYVFNDDKNERHVTESTLSWKAGIRSQTIRKLVRQGKLIARILPQGIYVFLQQENPNLFDVIETELEELAAKKAR